MSFVERSAPGRPVPLARAGERARTAAVSHWASALVALALVIWLIPIKRYTLPVQLPFNLEIYRLVILALMATFLIALFLGTRGFSAAGHGKPVVILAVAALAAQFANWGVISAAGAQTQALKSLSYFLSFLVAFVLVCSTLRTTDEVVTVLKGIVLGAAIVGVAALYESRFRTNLFNDMDRWLPFLDQTHEDKFNVRGGRLRVRASAQHPIALGAALTICIPLALYLWRRASSTVRGRLWLVAALVITAAAFATVSRTVSLMLLGMLVVAFLLRPRELLRRWWLLILLAGFTHYAAPGSISHMYWALTPKGGLIAEQQARAGTQGSGRVADLGPGLERWKRHPVVGHGLGLGGTTGELRTALTVRGAGRDDKRVIYDNQYLLTLVSLGALGFIGVIWFVWGGVVKLVRAARRTVGASSDLMAALAISCAGFAAGMLTHDAFAFVQVTLLFFLITALGLRAHALLKP